MPTDLEELIGVSFGDARLLQSAFVHRSYMHEHPERVQGLSSNERLEFLGDAVVNFIAASWLYGRYADLSEGELTSLRAALVKTTTLAGFARSLDLGAHVRISRGEDTEVARSRAPLLADLFEAVIGAIFLDQGMEAARAFLLPFFQRQLEAIQNGTAEIDYRTRLQEEAQARYNLTPAYRMVTMSGPDHQREFTLEVLVGARRIGVGSGPSKQSAAQAAARAALELLRSEGAP